MLNFAYKGISQGKYVEGEIEARASFVWSVLNTRCPVNAAFKAMSTVI